MKLSQLYRVEFNRLLHSKTIWLISVLCLLMPLLGYSVYKPTTAEASVMTSKYIADPVLAGTTFGSVLWAIAALIEAERLHRNDVDVLTDSVTSPVRLSAARTSALVTISLIVTVICSFVYLPYTVFKLRYLFNAGFYFANYFIFMDLTWVISILISEGLYGITRRIEIPVLIYAALGYYSISSSKRFEYFGSWLTPATAAYSDGFPSLWPLRIALYSRLIWICFAICLWIISLMCTRKYQRGLVCSFLYGMKKIYALLLVVIFAGAGTLMWCRQPFVDHSPEETSQQEHSDTYDCQYANGARYSLSFNTILGTICGKAEYDLKAVVRGENRLELNAGYEIKKITYDGKKIDFHTVNDDNLNRRSTYFTMPEKFDGTLVIEYSGLPAARNFARSSICSSIDREYISLNQYYRTLFPCLYNYIIDADKTDMEITIPDTLIPYLNSKPMIEYTDNGDGTRTYNTSCSQGVQNFIAANYVTDRITAGDTEIDFVYGQAYCETVRNSNVKQAIIDVFTYCSEHYGTLDFVENGSLILMQNSMMQMGGLAYPGSVQWFEDVLSPDALSDSARGASSQEVFIHEMIHQWWGTYGVRFDYKDDLWSAEGLTVYATYRLVKEKYGKLYAQQYYVDKWQKAVNEQDRNFYNRHPEYMDKLPESYQEKLRAKNRFTNQYMRMPLMILKAEQLIGGEEKMDKVLSRIYEEREKYTYDSPLTYKTFLDYCGLTEEVCGLE